MSCKSAPTQVNVLGRRKSAAVSQCQRRRRYAAQRPSLTALPLTLALKCPLRFDWRLQAVDHQVKNICKHPNLIPSGNMNLGAQVALDHPPSQPGEPRASR